MVTPAALIIGYVITASGFVLFFGPLSVVASLSGAADTRRHSCSRAVLGLFGGALLCALSYIVLLYVLLIGGWFNPYCDGFTLNSDPCNGHGSCYGAGQCVCEAGFGPEVSFTREPLCSRDHSPCTGDQLQRALAAADNTCCFGHGNITAGERCSCAPGFGPESIDDPSEYQQADGMRQTLGEPLCARHMVCTAEQLRYAVAQHEEAACGGLHFPGSRLLTPEWGEMLTGWTNSSVATDEWTLCFSSFADDATTPAVFHAQCDPYNATLSVAHNAGGEYNGKTNAGNYTFGGFGAGSWSVEACCADPRNDCTSASGYCVDQSSSQDFLFGLWMPGRADSAGPHRFLPTDADTAYQRAGPDRWPQWGNYGDDLNMGDNGPLGGSAGRCDPGVTGCARAPWATRLRTRRRAWWIRATGRPAPATAAATRTSIPARASATSTTTVQTAPKVGDLAHCFRARD